MKKAAKPKDARRDSSRKAVVIVDIDGTLADVTHRLHYVREAGQKNWKSFFAEQRNDPVKNEIVERVRELAKSHEIVVVTGRPDQYLKETKEWLRKHKIPFSRVFMRPAGDHRADYVVKKEILRRVGPEKVALVFEDRPPVCEMYRRAGLKVVEIPSDQSTQAINIAYAKKS